MRFFFDFLPLLAFFGVYGFADIYYATGACILATIIQVIWSWCKHRKVDKLLWVNFLAIVIFGGLTLFFHDKRFIMVKPTIVYWIISAGLLFSYVILRKNPIRLMMDSVFDAPEVIWKRWFALCVIFFFALGVLNLLVAYGFSEDIWVKFKIFGALLFCVLLMLAQVLALMPYAREGKQK
jgi:intracellular septation protein